MLLFCWCLPIMNYVTPGKCNIQFNSYIFLQVFMYWISVWGNQVMLILNGTHYNSLLMFTGYATPGFLECNIQLFLRLCTGFQLGSCFFFKRNTLYNLVDDILVIGPCINQNTIFNHCISPSLGLKTEDFKCCISFGSCFFWTEHTL